MKAWMFAVVFSLSYCVKKKNTSALKAFENTGPAPTDSLEFIPEDLSILYPIKGSPAMDTLFETEGTGICLVPRLSHKDLSTGMEVSFLSEATFQKISQLIFAGPSGCPVVDPRSGQASSALLAARDANGNPLHVAQIKGLPEEVCGYSNWRIVAFRFDPCLQRSKFGEKGPASEEAFVSDREAGEAAGKCQMETRLIVQPIVTDNGGNLRVIDDTFHLVYRVESAKDIINDLRSLKKIKDSVLKLKPWPMPTPDIVSLRPHAALRAEMSTCNESTSAEETKKRLDVNDLKQTQAPFAFAFVEFLKKHTPESKLMGVAWMTSDRGPSHWTFGTLKNESKTKFEISSVRVNGSFSDSEFNNRRFPFDHAQRISLIENLRGPNLQTKTTTPNIERFWGEEIILGKKLKDPETFEKLKVNAPHDKKNMDLNSFIKDLLLDLFFLENPGTVSQPQPESCLSCHMTDQTRKSTADKFDIVLADLPGAFMEGKVPSWSKLPHRDRKNLRNFGYAEGMVLGIARRTMNEATDATNYVNQIFKP